ncbi:hypothetical protein CALVIDRAFT_108556 [Calocera viscosa TUFC12733]|uniref:Uncharacterized protein n=1 Tax=Calocera viscosa (strain TUFC12733) TaxID=1330018 RepID=A0A167MDL7_CALVF|nr:hypothetical protein CALVIDRAFT_108556 [Calocera viscosa TUFC12733]
MNSDFSDVPHASQVLLKFDTTNGSQHCSPRIRVPKRAPPPGTQSARTTVACVSLPQLHTPTSTVRPPPLAKDLHSLPPPPALLPLYQPRPRTSDLAPASVCRISL